jgi:hypothetical protein
MSAGTVGFRGFGHTRAHELPDGQEAALSPSGRARIRYNDAAKQLEASIDGASYEAIGAAGGGGTTVADFAAVTALDDAAFAEGANVAVASVRDFFELDKTSTLTVDGVTVLATASGSGRWLRRSVPSLAWVSQTTWHINASTGDDENDGNTAGTALATHAELVRRIGDLPVMDFVFVNIDSDLTEDIQMPFRCITEGGQLVGAMLYSGTTSVVRSGTFTAGTQDWVHTPQASRQEGLVVQSGLGSWERAIGQRIRVTSGPSTDAVSWVLSNTAADTARVSTWMDINTFGGVAGPSSGDDYDIEQLPVITGSITAEGAAVISFNSIAVEQPGSGLLVVDTEANTFQPNFCDLRGDLFITGASFLPTTLLASKLQVVTIRLRTGSAIAFGGCAVLGRVDARPSSWVSFEFDPTIIQNPGAAGAGGVDNIVAAVMQFDGATGEIFNTVAVAMFDMTAAGATAVQLRQGANFRQLGPLWARDCTMSTGLVARAASVYSYPNTADGLPDIATPATQDTLIGGVAVAFGALPSAQAASLAGIVIDQ